VPQFKYVASGSYVIASDGTGVGEVGYQVSVTSRGWSGSVVFAQNIAPPGSVPSYVNVAYQDANTGTEFAAGVAITGTAAVIISPTVGDLIAIVTVTTGEVIINVNPATQGVTNRELRNAFVAAGYDTAGQDTTEAMLSVAVAGMLGQVLDVRAFGAKGDGVTDDTAAIQACFNAASAIATADGLATVEVLVPAGIYAVSSVLALPATVSLHLGGTIKATAAISAVIQTPLTSVARNQRIAGTGTIDCNDLADVGVDLRYFARYTLSDFNVLSYNVAGVRLGDPTAASTSYEPILSNVRVARSTIAVPSGSIGCHVRYATDGLFNSCLFIGAETGMKLEASAVWHIVQQVHCWAIGSTVTLNQMQDAFVDLGFNNSFIGCYADTPQRYGFYFAESFARVIGCNVYNGVFGGSDNQLVGVHFVNSLANATVTGLLCYGENSSRRILRDIEFAGGSVAQDTCNIMGVRGNAQVTNVSAYRTASNAPFSVTLGTMFLGSSSFTRASGTPEGSRTAVISSLNLRSDGGLSTSVAAKNSGTGNTGWANLWTGEVSADRGDTSQTLTVGADAPIQRWASALGANRTVTLSTTGALNGDRFRIVRTGLGAFTLDVGGLKTIPSATAAFVDVSYNGSAWVLTGYGLL